MCRKVISGVMLILLSISMLTLAFSIRTVETEPTTITVPDDYEKIQWAIGNASNGDIIFVRTGTYNENVFVNKTVSLVGENKYNTIIDGNGTGSVVYITANNVNVTGFTIQNSGAGFPDSGILLSGSDGTHTKRNIITNNKFGILLLSSSNNSLVDNIVSNNLHGIELYINSKANRLINNNVSKNNAGILLYEADSNSLKDNIVLSNNFGIVLGYSNNNIIKGNTVSNAGWSGIRIVDHSDGNLLLNNTISNNLDGLELTYANDNTLVNNIALHNRRYGIAVAYSNNNVLVSNTVLNNEYGIRVSESGSNNTIYHNNFINNTLQAYILLSPLNTIWDDGYPSGGNYWSDYSGIDLFKGLYQNETGSDGIGDTPYVVDENNQDNYPLVEPWSPKPSSPVEATQELIETIETWSLPKGTENSLKAKLKVAIHMLDLEKEDGAIRKLTAFINRAEILRDKTLTNEQADYLISEAQRIIDLINE
ncbi:MAG: right-handed parallel beta-helix repeat-containing protein [Candidatus Bathyarchaeota archaeon]|nr:right-handed parallel beta-helix repeat-containing protein [Candidatus Bathyarchaeota archaeon]